MTSFDSTANNTVPELAIPTSKDNNNLQGPTVASIDSGAVQAYAKLEGDDFCYYVRTLQVTLGRKVSNPENVDILLGNTKSVSRQHARLFFNFSTQRFELMVFGKNGAFVNERFIEKGVTVPLDNKTKIQIGEMAFVFLLPRPETNDVNKNKNTVQHDLEDFGYISTPHQLEKVKQRTADTEDVDIGDDSGNDDNSSVTSEANVYSNKDTKPPYSYASLIAQAINSTNDKKMTLNGIYNYITSHFPYYQLAQNGWQNSIRHNLSLNKAFIKVPRGDAEPGKGAFWTIDPNTETQFSNGVYKRTKRPSFINSRPDLDAPKKKHKKETLIEEDSYNLDTEPLDNENKTEEFVAVPVIIEESFKKQATPPEKASSSSTETLQMQLQNTIRQHLLDPVRYPLPPSIAQLLPQAIAQLPPQLATQLSSTLNVKTSENKENNPTQK